MSDELVEMLIDGTWTEVTTDVRVANTITVTRGKGELASQAGPSSCSLTLNNRDGKFSPRNPVGPYFGKIGRNTQIRVAEKVDAAFDAYSNTSGTGDLSWTHTLAGTPTGVAVWIWQYNTNANQIASVTYGGVPMALKTNGLFTLQAVNAVGYMYWLNRNIPPGAQTIVVDTTAVIGRQASAVSFTGGSNCELDNNQFAYSGATPSANPGMGLTVFKRAVLVGSLLSDLDDGSTIAVTAGFTELGEHDIGTETVNVMRAGIQAPASYGINWTAASAGWGIMAVAVRAVSYRFLGEISELPPRWDLSHKEAWVPVTAAGALRRYQQGNEPANIGLREYILSKPQALTSYWPLSGAEGTKFSINLGKTWEGSTRFFPEFTPSFTYGKDLGAPWLGSALEINATGNVSNMRGDVGTGEQSGVALDFVWQSTAMGVLTAVVADYRDNRWSVTLNTSTDDGTAQVSFDDPSVGPIGFSATGVLAALQDQEVHHCRLQMIVNGADTDFTLYIDGVSVDTGTMAGYTWLGTGTCRFYYSRFVNQTYVNLAHVTVWSENNPANIPSAADVSAAVHGYTGETAGARMTRVAGLAGIPLKIVGTVADTSKMGVQFAEPVLAQIRDAEATDLGVLTESRDALELMYRTRASLYNQTPKLTLDYSLKTVAPPFEPVDDDAAIRNDVTVSRRNGDSFRLTQTSGSLSTLAPPNGVGPYSDEISVNCETDAQLPVYAGWFLNLGTLDKLRFPTLTVNLAAPAAAALKTQVLACDVGDLIRITNLDVLGIYDDLDLIIVGYDETIDPVVHTWTAQLVPADLYQPAVYATSETVGTARYDTNSSALVSGVTSSATSLSVSSVRTVWTLDADSFPFDIVIGGERITVTAITGATSPQTFTVTRAVNGVSKAHDANADVRLYPTPRYAL
ncbi:hypothetical protein [Kribbella catacumbae]|uniref:hypothetical protein n=1 Tax=Kribbella catacumbae TaxID=460086 RepID=UPI0003678133|nr:hypothetical protein [Kribbella catacumbae]